MRSSNKPRSRNKNNNNRRSNPTNVLNRVFDSSGPEGKVRGTPQQIIDKYQSHASDAMLSGDRVNSENFLQHAEHYSRVLLEAQREIDERREAHDAQRQHQNKPSPDQPKVAEVGDVQPDVSGNTNELFPAQSDQSNLVETPESKREPTKVKVPVKKVEITQSESEETPKVSTPDAAAE